MRYRTKAIIAIGMLVTAVWVAAVCKVYFIREDSGGDVLWNANEAYFFIGVSRRGIHVSCLRYPWLLVKEYVGSVQSPDDDQGSLVVLHVTSYGVEHQNLKLLDRRPGSGPNQYTPLEGHIYANWPALAGLSRWAGNHFEPATQEERQGLDGTNRLIAREMDNMNGWNKRGIGTSPLDHKLTIAVGNGFSLSVNNVAVRGTGSLSIDLLKAGKAPERMWNLSGSSRRVNKTEYERAFRESQ
jgi:hypothetical protein